VFLSGISVPDREVLDLARRLRATGFDEEAEKLEDAHRREVRILALEIAEREAILRALEECPDGSLAELRRRYFGTSPGFDNRASPTVSTGR
jgi:hypothetical protein